MRVSYKYDETVVNTNNLTIVDTNNYYPFVLKHKGYGSPNQTPSYKYKYNGKELQDELGLNWYDYGARNYDAALGRWMNVDPLAEMFPSWSPYSYTFSNPVRYTDPTGMAPECDGCPDNASIGDVFDHPDYGQVTYNGQNWGNEQYGNIMNSIEITNSNNSDGTTESINQDYSLNLNPFNDYLKKYYKGPASGIYGPYNPDGIGFSTNLSAFGSSFGISVVRDARNNFDMFFSYSGAVGFSSGDISSYLPSFSATMDFYEKTNSNVNLFNGISGASNDINGGYGVTFGHSRPSEGIGSNKVSFGLGGGIRMGESKTYSSSEIISNFKNYVKSIKP